MADSVVLTPTSIKANIEAATLYINTLDKEIEGQARTTRAGTRMLWRPFFDSFEKWKRSDPSLMWVSTSDTAYDYGRRAGLFRQLFLDDGGVTKTQPWETWYKGKLDAGPIVKGLVLVGGIVATAYLVNAIATATSRK